MANDVVGLEALTRKLLAAVQKYSVPGKVTGREIPQVLLLHANALNADRLGALAGALVRRGYRFVPLAQALEDPAHRLPDELVGAPGNSWFSP